MQHITEHPTTPTGVTPEASDPARLWWCVAIATQNRAFEVHAPMGWTLAVWREYAEIVYGDAVVTPLDPLDLIRPSGVVPPARYYAPSLYEHPLRDGVSVRRTVPQDFEDDIQF